MRTLPARISLTATVVSFMGIALNACESTETAKKKRPLLPGEEMSELSWSRPTGPNDVVTPIGLPMSR